ncbi:MAG: hypothetical protein ACE3L7_12690 [Candidatus Pristimantibacillus sp.]
MNLLWIIVIIVAYIPVLYMMNKRIRVLEEKIEELKNKDLMRNP